jgi:hypothetical protein
MVVAVQEQMTRSKAQMAALAVVVAMPHQQAA